MSVKTLCSTILYCASVRNEIVQGNIRPMFPNENVFRLSIYPISPAATEGTCTGLCCSGWSIPGSFTSVPVTLSLHRNLSFSSRSSRKLVLDGKKMLLYAQQFFLHNTNVAYMVHNSIIHVYVGGGGGGSRTQWHL